MVPPDIVQRGNKDDHPAALWQAGKGKGASRQAGRQARGQAGSGVSTGQASL